MIDFSKRTAVVTGAAQGIGKAIAKVYLENGVKQLAMIDYNGEKVQETARELDPSGERAFAFACDISNRDQVHETFAKIYEMFGRIDILINNAGINRDAMFHKMTYEQMRAVMEVNFFGTYYCTSEVILPMRAQEYGRIINISSTSAHGTVGQANYAASKGAINGFTRTLALESARKNITVNAIEPGFIETDMLRTIPEPQYNAKLAAHAAQRFGTPLELANLAAFLGSDEASWVNGSIVICSGAGKIV